MNSNEVKELQIKYYFDIDSWWYLEGIIDALEDYHNKPFDQFGSDDTNIKNNYLMGWVDAGGIT